MNHKYSTGVLMFMGFIFFISIAGALLTSSDLDEVCDMDNHTLFRWNSTWMCGSLAGLQINYTNYTYITTNSTDFWDDLDKPSDINTIDLN